MTFQDKKTPAPAATGNKGQASNNLQKSERPSIYHSICYRDGIYLVAVCGTRFKDGEVTVMPASRGVDCALCEAGIYLNTEVKW